MQIHDVPVRALTLSAFGRCPRSGACRGHRTPASSWCFSALSPAHCTTRESKIKLNQTARLSVTRGHWSQSLHAGRTGAAAAQPLRTQGRPSAIKQSQAGTKSDSDITRLDLSGRGWFKTPDSRGGLSDLTPCTRHGRRPDPGPVTLLLSFLSHLQNGGPVMPLPLVVRTVPGACQV